MTQRPAWSDQAQALKDFWTENGALPAQNDGSLGRWLHTQRYTRDLSEERRQWLDTQVPAWGLTYNRTWQIRAEELRDFVAQNGCLPMITGSSLGRWLGVQRSGRSLGIDRKAWLDEHVPGWDDSTHQAWIDRAKELESFVARHGAFPTVRDESLGWWLSNQRKGQGLSETRRQWLDTHLPGWHIAADPHHCGSLIQIPAVRPECHEDFLAELKHRVRHTQRTQAVGSPVEGAWLEEVASSLHSFTAKALVAVPGHSLADEAWALALSVTAPARTRA